MVRRMVEPFKIQVVFFDNNSTLQGAYSSGDERSRADGDSIYGPFIGDPFKIMEIYRTSLHTRREPEQASKQRRMAIGKVCSFDGAGTTDDRVLFSIR